MLKNSLKVAILGIVGFLLLVFLTAPEQIENKKSKQIDVSLLPDYMQISNEDKYLKRAELFDNDYLIVLNHDSIAVFNELDKYTDKRIVLAANISKAPWVIKKLGVSREITRLYKQSEYKLIFDQSGDIIKTIGLTDVSQNSYNIYEIKDGNLKFLKRDLVKRNALQEGITSQEKQNYLKTVSSYLQ